jgi:hypothetical protein
VYADSGAGKGMRKGLGMQTVVEVLADRWGEGMGAWGVLKEGITEGTEEANEGKERSGEASGRRSAWGLNWEVARG